MPKMKNKHKLAILITALTIVGGIYAFRDGKIKVTQEQTTPPQNQDIEFNLIKREDKEIAQGTLPEEPNKDKFNEYFSEARLAKIPAGEELDPLKTVNTGLFSPKDQFCTFLNVKKTIPANRLSWTFYDVNSKKDITEKNIAPVEITAENNFGCTNLTYPAGKYEQRIYVDNTLVAILPFEIK